MKCQFCEKEIPDGSLFCPYCGEGLEAGSAPSKSTPEEVKTATPEFLDENTQTKESMQALANRRKRAGSALLYGILSLIFGLLFSGFYFPSLGMLFGAVAIILAVSAFKKGFQNKLIAAGVCGILGMVIAGFSLYQAVSDLKISEAADEFYSAELNIDLPDFSPDYYYVSSSLYGVVETLPKREFQYELTDPQSAAFLNAIAEDSRWNHFPLDPELESFLDENFNLLLEYEGHYLFYDRTRVAFTFPPDYGTYLEEYDFVLVFFDDTQDRIVIYDVYQSK
jgi:hypothetical protein